MTLTNLFDTFIGIGFLTISVVVLFLTFSAGLVFFEILIISCLFLFGIHPITLFINYYNFGKDKEIEFDLEKELISVTDCGSQKKLAIKNIEKIDIYESSSIGLYGLDFTHIKYYFNNKKTLIVTCLMSKTFYIPNGIEPQFSMDILPLINEQYEDKIFKESGFEKLLKKYEKLESKDLEKTLSSKGFRISAKKAAEKTLDNRKNGIQH